MLVMGQRVNSLANSSFFFLSKSRQKDHKFVFVCIYLESSFYIYNILT